jgi:hypothetical protein
MNLKNGLKSFAGRLLRLLGIIAVLYVSMVFYLALTERRNAYPRAITHKEARQAIAGKAEILTCTLEDGTALEGWKLGTATGTLLYYPDADEDAAQFLAETDRLEGLTLITFNYRGSGNNKGTPSAETFSTDAAGIAECAMQATGAHPDYFAGRGTGAILAANNAQEDSRIILIDPVWSIADALSYKYRKLYPRFIIRAKDTINSDKMTRRIDQVRILLDRAQFEDRSKKILEKIPGATARKRGGASFRSAFQEIVKSSQNN